MFEQFYSDTVLFANEVETDEVEYTLNLDELMQKFYSSGTDFLNFYRKQFSQDEKKMKKVIKSKTPLNFSKEVSTQLELFPSLRGDIASFERSFLMKESKILKTKVKRSKRKAIQLPLFL